MNIIFHLILSICISQRIILICDKLRYDILIYRIDVISLNPLTDEHNVINY